MRIDSNGVGLAIAEPLSVSGEKNLVSAEMNVVAVAGSAATFNCSSINQDTSRSGSTSVVATRWHYTGYGRRTPVCIYNGREINDEFGSRYAVRLDGATSSCLLTISDVRLSDAGKFTCSRIKSSSKISTFSLTVLGTPVRRSSYDSAIYAMAECLFVTSRCLSKRLDESSCFFLTRSVSYTVFIIIYYYAKWQHT